MKKTCIECKKDYKYVRGNGTTTKHCTTCMSRINRAKMRAKIESYVGGFCCKLCGYNKCKRAISFHHLDPNNKKFTLSQDCWMYSWNRIKAEIDKCIMVCSNCHMEIESGLIPSV